MDIKTKVTTLKDKIAYFYSKHKILVFILSAIILLILVLIIGNVFSRKKVEQPSTKKASPTPEVVTNIDSNGNPDSFNRSDVNSVYLINRFDSLVGIIGYAWVSNKIVYATQNGIYELWQNKQLLADKIASISFDKSGNCVYSNGTDTYYFNIEQLEKVKLDIGGKNPKISSSGNYLLSTNSENIYLFNIATKNSVLLPVSTTTNKDIGWVSDTDNFLVYNKNSRLLQIYNKDSQLLREFQINETESFVNINSDLGVLLTSSSSGIVAKNTKTSESIVYKFTDSIDLKTHWIDSDKFYVNQKVNRGLYDLYDQYFWLVDTSIQNKKLLTNSMVVTNKINADIDISINQGKTALLFSENNGKIWVISLITNKIATYLENGVSFYTMNGSQRQDD
jgi:hypothetical protein